MAAPHRLTILTLYCHPLVYSTERDKRRAPPFGGRRVISQREIDELVELMAERIAEYGGSLDTDELYDQNGLPA